jgi:hypothetical protein
MQPGYPGQDPYGQQPPPDPTAQQPYQDPYTQPYPPASPGQTAYGQPASAPPYQDPYAPQPPMPGQPYGPAAGYPAAGPQTQNSLGMTALITGIVSIPLAFCCSVLSLLAGLVAVVLGFLGHGKAKRGEASNGGVAMAGLICGAIGILLSVVWIILVVFLQIGSFMITP